METLAGGIAHDFNNLLTGILGNASLALSTVPPESEAARLIEGVIAGAERAALLTSELLAYVGKGSFATAETDFDETVSKAVQAARATGRYAEVRVLLEKNLPKIYADAARIELAVENLVKNAMEAVADHPHGLVTVSTGRVTIGSRDAAPAVCAGEVGEGEYLTVRVRDNGIGMDGRVMERMFEPFFSTKFMGRGLGLAAVAGIVRTHGGAIAAKSEPGKGTEFTLFFPALERARKPANKERTMWPLACELNSW